VTGRPIEAGCRRRDTAPAIVAGDDVYPIGGPWRFRTGDDPSYGSRGFDEDAWETIPVPQRWTKPAGHIRSTRVCVVSEPGSGYRVQATGKSEPRNVYLELGKIADADEAFVKRRESRPDGRAVPGGPG